MLRAPCALSIAGLDPSGGAGLFADLRAFAAAGAWGCGAAAVLTVQSTRGLAEAHPVPASRLLAQVKELLAHQHVRAIKIGALGSAANVRAVRRLLRPLAASLPIVLDPVMSASRGRGRTGLLDRSAGAEMRALASLPCIVTPNAPEAEALVGARIGTIAEAAHAARVLVARGARAALVKGGHLGGGESIDVLVVKTETIYLRARRFRTRLHGTGCTLASLIAGKLAMRPGALTTEEIIEAVRWAKQRLTRSIANAVRIGDGLLVLPA
jgi:hydroxymethylpyrimidine/phosphomethylpyrimidine kinase